MPSGFEATNEYGTFLVKNDAVNLAMLQKQAINFNSQGYGGALPSGIIRALRCTGHMAPTFGGTSFGPANGSATVYSFGLPVAPSGPGYGLQVFQPDGTLAFDARLKHARAVDAIDVPFSSSNLGTTISRSYPSGRTYAVSLTSLPYYRKTVLYPDNRPGFPPDTFFWYELFYYTAGVSVNGGNINIKWVQTDYYDHRGEESVQAIYVPPSIDTGNRLLAHVVDVTGY